MRSRRTFEAELQPKGMCSGTARSFPVGVTARVHYLARIMNPNPAMPKWSLPLEEIDVKTQETAKGGTA